VDVVTALKKFSTHKRDWILGENAAPAAAMPPFATAG
jgi:hypothetical protein